VCLSLGRILWRFTAARHLQLPDRVLEDCPIFPGVIAKKANGGPG